VSGDRTHAGGDRMHASDSIANGFADPQLRHVRSSRLLCVCMHAHTCVHELATSCGPLDCCACACMRTCMCVDWQPAEAVTEVSMPT
jgi:hypothetical protein